MLYLTTCLSIVHELHTPNIWVMSLCGLPGLYLGYEQVLLGPSGLQAIHDPQKDMESQQQPRKPNQITCSISTHQSSSPKWIRSNGLTHTKSDPTRMTKNFKHIIMTYPPKFLKES